MWAIELMQAMEPMQAMEAMEPTDPMEEMEALDALTWYSGTPHYIHHFNFEMLNSLPETNI